MRAIEFPQVTKTLQKPKGMTDEQCMPLPVFNDGKQSVSCWALNKEELELIQKTGKIYLGIVFGPTQPPVWLSIEDPFVEPKEEVEQTITPEVLRYKLNDFNARRNIIKAEQRMVERKYLSDNAKFKKDDKVIVARGTKGERIAFINGSEIGPQQSIVYKFALCKKDGTKGKNTTYVYADETVELLADNTNE